MDDIHWLMMNYYWVDCFVSLLIIIIIIIIIIIAAFSLSVPAELSVVLPIERVQHFLFRNSPNGFGCFYKRYLPSWSVGVFIVIWWWWDNRKISNNNNNKTTTNQIQITNNEELDRWSIYPLSIDLSVPSVLVQTFEFGNWISPLQYVDSNRFVSWMLRSSK